MNIEAMAKLVSPMGILLVLIVIVGIITILIILYKFFKKSNIKIGNFELSGNNTMEFQKFIKQLVGRVTDNSLKKWKYKYIDTLEAQLNFAEQRLMELKGVLTDIYRKIYSIKYKNDANCDQILFYMVIVQLVLDVRIKKFIKDSFIKNHFTDLDEPKFNVYVKDKVDVAIQIIKEQIDVYYIPQNNITAQEIIKKIEENYDIIYNIIKSIFVNACYQSKSYDELIDKIDNDIIDIISEYDNK